jgi:hypothetical protein
MLSTNPPAFVHHFDSDTSSLHAINPADLRPVIHHGTSLRPACLLADRVFNIRSGLFTIFILKPLGCTPSTRRACLPEGRSAAGP